MSDSESVMKNEHGELLELLEGISGKGGRTGEIFSEILGLFRQHLEREEETVIPLLGVPEEKAQRFRRG